MSGIVYVFVMAQMVELLDTAANTATYLMSVVGARTTIVQESRYPKREYFTLLLKVALLTTTWMDLEMIILSEVSQTEKGKYHMIPLICGI